MRQAILEALYSLALIKRKVRPCNTTKSELWLAVSGMSSSDFEREYENMLAEGDLVSGGMTVNKIPLIKLPIVQ